MAYCYFMINIACTHCQNCFGDISLWNGDNNEDIVEEWRQWRFEQFVFGANFPDKVHAVQPLWINQSFWNKQTASIRKTTSEANLTIVKNFAYLCVSDIYLTFLSGYIFESKLGSVPFTDMQEPPLLEFIFGVPTFFSQLLENSEIVLNHEKQVLWNIPQKKLAFLLYSYIISVCSSLRSRWYS